MPCRCRPRKWTCWVPGGREYGVAGGGGGGLRVPFSSVVGAQCREVLFMGPLWLMRVGRRLGVRGLGLRGWMDSIVGFAFWMGVVLVWSWVVLGLDFCDGDACGEIMVCVEGLLVEID